MSAARHNRKTGYENQIDALISDAEQLANKRAGKPPHRLSPEWKTWSAKWDHIYHDIMDTLAHKQNYRCQSHQQPHLY